MANVCPLMLNCIWTTVEKRVDFEFSLIMTDKDDILRRANEYTLLHDLTLGDELGAGVHGIVFATECQSEFAARPVQSAVKVHRSETGYLRERDVYHRLQSHQVSNVRGCNVPQLLRYDDSRWVIEMTVVARPFLLDFAGALLDFPPDFSDEVRTDWLAEKREQFGDTAGRKLRRYWRHWKYNGVFMLDVSPANVALD